MKIVVQRSGPSRVEVAGVVVGSIPKGLVLLVCLESGDTAASLEAARQKILALRCFEDDAGKMNRNILESQGELLAISQFTLSWDGKKGNRPSFDRSMPPAEAQKMFQDFCEGLRTQVPVSTGRFGEHMHVFIHNDGPVTFTLSF